MKIGQTVYTVNNKTNTIDEWTFNGVLNTGGKRLCHLVNGKKYCFLPHNAVYSTRTKALQIAKLK